MQKTHRPARIIKSTSYGELKEFAAGFADGRLNRLAVFGAPGVGKSECFRQALSNAAELSDWATLSEHATPRSLYQFLFENSQSAIVIDDVDELLKDSATTALLKSALDTGRNCRIAWRALKGREENEDAPPDEFDFRGRCAILANTFRHANPDVAAIYDRCLCIEFSPDSAELHREIESARWFRDSEVIAFVGEHLHLVREPSFRFYVQLAQLRESKLDWQSIGLRLLENQNSREEIVVQKLIDDTSFDQIRGGEAARVSAFIELTKMSRAKYFRIKGELERRRSRSLPSNQRVASAEVPQFGNEHDFVALEVRPLLPRDDEIESKSQTHGAMLN